jgi:acyl-homoserine-lactone acylase
MFPTMTRAIARWLSVCAVLWLLTHPAVAQSAAETLVDPTTPALSPKERDEAARLARGATIYRDGFGVPHIHGQSDEHLLFAYAYAQAEDNFWQIEDTYILGLGRYCEVHGHFGLNSDLLNRAFEIVPQSQLAFERLDPKVQSACAAFTLGLNYYLATHPQTKPRLITHFEPWHVVAYGRQILLELCFRYTRLSHNFLPRSSDLIWTAAGSNGWAIAPGRTRDGHAMLFVNPHLPWFGFSQMHEAHLVSDEGWAFAGGTMFGSCLPTLGHNEHLGWTLTTNEPDIADVWRETFDDAAHPLRYRYADGYREATEWSSVIKIKSGARMSERTVKLRKTHHGPIVAQEDQQHYLAAQVAGLDCMVLKQQLQLVRAKNLEEFNEGLKQQQFPVMNVIYADKAGNIMYLYNGLIPRRDPRFNWSLPVDGADPRTAWHGVHKLDELPQVLNPADGYVQNCNSSPFTTCTSANCDPSKFPPYMVEDSDQDKRRAKISRQLLGDMKSVSFEQLQEAAFDTTVYWAQEQLPRYARRFKELRISDPELAAEVAPYLEQLLAWDCRIAAESTAATLCEAWYLELFGMEYPAETLFPRFLRDPKLEFRALVTAADKLKTTHGTWQVPWGSLFRIQRRPNMVDLHELSFDDKLPSLPSLGAPGPLGIVFTQYYSPTIKIPFVMSINKRYGLLGASYMAVYEFGPKIRSASALNYGESGDPKSPHYFDQARLLSERKLKPDLFEWSDVVAGAKTVYKPGEPPVERVAK